MDRRRTITQEVTTDLLEDVFDLTPCTTTKDIMVVDQQPIIRPSDYDDKDGEIDEQFQEVYDKAMSAFEYQMERADSTDVEPKYVARMHEVAAGYLGTALAAAKEKAAIKSNKDKITATVKKAAALTQNNTMIVTHSSLLDMLSKEYGEAGKVIEGEVLPSEEFGDDL